jgi:ATP-dependent DNA ligase
MSVRRDGKALLRATEAMDFEGIVAKRSADAYGPETVWYKILSPSYTQKEGRAEWFHRQRQR